MATIAELRARSEDLFSQLLVARTEPRERREAARAAEAPPAEPFSWFDPEDAVRAATLAFRLSATAASKPRANDGLAAALEHVAEEAERADPEEVRQGFALFVTHNRAGRRLAKPRTVTAAPALFSPPRAEPEGRREISIGGESPGLDYWREDALANEHHQHWHEVYPFTGLPPPDFLQWVGERSPEELVAILDTIQPNPEWPEIVAAATPAQLAGAFAQVVRHERVFALAPNLYKLLFRLNDRQGELFFYMHQQMLARYDAELLSNGLERVVPFGPDAWDEPLAAGHDPVGLADLGRREPDQKLLDEDVTALRARWDEIETALVTKSLRGADGNAVPIDRTLLGEAVEAVVRQLRSLDPNAYRGLHNRGHGAISDLSNPPPGVMDATDTAIRDQAFWQWHKFIDDVNARWQDGRGAESFADATDVLVRNTLDSGDEPWTSPDIILVSTADLPAGADLDRLGEQLFGGDNWSKDFTATEARNDGTAVRTLAELTTRMVTVEFGGSQIRHLTHDPFSYFIRIENRAAEQTDVTVRVFLAPADTAEDRRMWIEMDKFAVALAPATKVVVHRPDTESSVVKRPVDLGPSDVAGNGADGDGDRYCDCGWPYTLLLPRGNGGGMAFRLLVVCTDTAIDRVPAPGHCGSMSFCGAVDRYPDTRDMGYPFHRPFGQGATALQDAIVRLPHAAARTVAIRHV